MRGMRVVQRIASTHWGLPSQYRILATGIGCWRQLQVTLPRRLAAGILVSR